MEIIESKIDAESKSFLENQSFMSKLVEELKEKSKIAKNGGTESSRKKHKDRSKLLVRERLELLFDKGTPFLELSPLAAYDMYDNEAPSAGMITGIGVVHGKEVMVIANDATVKGGTYFPITIKKHLRAQQIAMDNLLPCIYLVDSGGIFLPLQKDTFPDKEHFGKIFYNQARLSALGVPQISAVMGSCTAGGAYLPAMSDENVIVKGEGTIFIGGPPLVKAATGEVVTPDELGGADVHCRISGVSDYYAENDEHAIEITRSIIENIKAPEKFPIERSLPEEPLYDPKELYGIIFKDPKKSFEVREVIARIVDKSEFHEFKKYYGTTLVTGFAKIMGYPVGIIANNGVLFSESSLKGAHFVMLCASRKIPLVFLQNITGFIVGKNYEHGGIAKNGAKMVHAVANADVPKFTIIIGGSYGAGNYAMCGRAYNPRFLWMWPNAKICVMGGKQAGDVLLTVKVNAMKKRGLVMSEKEQKDFMDSIIDGYSKESSAYYSTARLWDDGIIDPLDTRGVLALGIATSLSMHIPETKYGIFRM